MSGHAEVSELANVNGVQLAYQVCGTGAPLVLPG